MIILNFVFHFHLPLSELRGTKDFHKFVKGCTNQINKHIAVGFPRLLVNIGKPTNEKPTQHFTIFLVLQASSLNDLISFWLRLYDCSSRNPCENSSPFG